MKQQIIQLFKERSKGRGKVVFLPEIKVKRTKDIIYISEMHERAIVGSPNAFFVRVEIGCCNNHIIMPLGMMDELSLCAIGKSLQCKEERLLSIEKK